MTDGRLLKEQLLETLQLLPEAASGAAFAATRFETAAAGKTRLASPA